MFEQEQSPESWVDWVREAFAERMLASRPALVLETLCSGAGTPAVALQVNYNQKIEEMSPDGLTADSRLHCESLSLGCLGCIACLL